MTLAELVYRDTAGFPREEVFGLTTQTRKSAVSVPSNIAEGAGRNTTPELVHFLGISCGSLAELDTQLELAVRLGYLKADSGAHQSPSPSLIASCGAHPALRSAGSSRRPFRIAKARPIEKSRVFLS